MKEVRKNYNPHELEQIKNQLLKKYQEIQEMVDEYNQIKNTIGQYGAGIRLEFEYRKTRFRNNMNWDESREFDSLIWEYFFGSAGLQNVMSTNQIKKYQSKLDDPEPFTARKAMEYKVNGVEIARETVKILVEDVFDSLTNQWYWTGGQRKKRNNLKIDQNSHINEWVKQNIYSEKWEYSYSYEPIFRDIEKCCLLLDGKKPVKYPDDINTRIKNLPITENKIENEYFELTLYKKGTQKLKFKRLDILEKINKYGPKKAALGQDVKITVWNR